MLIDSHAHVNFKQFEKDRAEVIQRTLDKGIQMINVGSQYTTSERAVEIANENEKGIYAAIGLHPIHLEDQVYEDLIDGEKIEFRTRAEKFDYDKYKQLAKDNKVVALGETGLDFYHIQSKDKESILKLQKQTLAEHLNLACELNKPVILHCRDAYQEMLEFLQERNEKINGVIHCYSGTYEQALQYMELGLYVGFTGIITFKNAKDIQAVAKQIPIDRVLVETDCPYLAPEPYRGKRNEPSYVQFVADKIAELKNESKEMVYDITTSNTKKLFNLN
ncbi:MAG: TatD family hydrolase [Patescibacteria group bacterium]